MNILDPKVHRQLIADIDHYTRVANIPQKFVEESAKDYCTESEIEWLTHFRERADQGSYGAVMSDSGEESPHVRMMAMAGACLRNFVDARVLTLQQVLDSAKKSQTLNPTVLLIPNFCLTKEEGGDLPSWAAALISDLLFSRLGSGAYTVVYAPKPEVVKTQYGSTLHDLFKNHYEVI